VGIDFDAFEVHEGQIIVVRGVNDDGDDTFALMERRGGVVRLCGLFMSRERAERTAVLARGCRVMIELLSAAQLDAFRRALDAADRRAGDAIQNRMQAADAFCLEHLQRSFLDVLAYYGVPASVVSPTISGRVH